MLNKTTNIICIGLLLIVGLVYRCINLDQQGILLYDEGGLILRAQAFYDHILNIKEAPSFAYVDLKIVWIMFLTIIRFFTSSLYFTQLAVVGLSMLTIWQTYVLARNYFDSKLIALFTCMWMTFSSIHILYSRLLLAEQMVLLFSLLSCNFYLKKVKGSRYAHYFAGMFMGFACLSNLTRVITLPIFILLIELFKGTAGSLKSRIIRYGVYLLSSVLTVVILSICLYGSFKLFGLNLDGFLEGIKYNLNFNEYANRKNVFSGLSFFYILWHLEGWSIFAVFTYLLLNNKNRLTAAFPLLVVILHILIFSFASLKVPRMLVVITPYFAMCYGLVFYDIYKRCESSRINKVFGFLLIFLVLFSSLWKVKTEFTFKSSLNDAIALIEKKDPKAGILSTNKFNTLYYSDSDKVLQLDFKYTMFDLYAAYNDGYRYLLLDQVKHLACSFDGDYNNTVLTPVFFHIENKCPVFATVPHFNKDLMRWAAMEGNQSLARTMYFVDNLKSNSGDIDIYNLKDCLASF